MSSTCEDGLVSSACTYDTTTAGTVRYYNNTCNVCCPVGQTVPTEFAPAWTCVSDVYMHSIFGVQIGLYSIALIISFTLFVLRARFGTAGPAFIAFLGAVVSGIGLGDALLIFFFGRSYNSSFNVFWLLFASYSILWFLAFSTGTHQKKDWEDLDNKAKSKMTISGAKEALNNVFTSSDQCRFNFSVTGLVFIVIIETGVGYAMHTYFNWGSGAAFVYVFGASWVNLIISTLWFGYTWFETGMSLIVTTTGVCLAGAYISPLVG